MNIQARTAVAVLGIGFGTPCSARADVDVSVALRALAPQPIPRALRVPQHGHYAFLSRPNDPSELPPNAVPIAGGWFAIYADERNAQGLAQLPELNLAWAPPRRLLLDRAGAWTRATTVRNRTRLTGRGTVIGIVDSGVATAHRDLRNPDGSTRVRWFIDFTQRARQVHAELEAEYACDSELSPCAIYSATDIDALLANSRAGDEPTDGVGHGTHVASLAAGNGLSSALPRYVGVAPEADLVVARVVLDSGAILDGDILRAARFVFDRARDLGGPAVLNLSLGSDFGAHDGTSALEQALSSFVDTNEPGRAIVVAAGNSAGLYTGAETGLPPPYGVHTEVHIPRYSPVHVPLITGLGRSGRTRATVYVWLAFREGDAVSVGVERSGDTLVPGVRRGRATAVRSGEIDVTVLNAVERGSPNSAVVVIDGNFEADAQFAIRLTGHGTASLWVQSSGGLDPSQSLGALFPRASKEGTINVPASAPALIAVGATLNRIEWTDHRGERVVDAVHGSLMEAPPDTTAYFSSAGPNALGMLKPDIVAPGANLIGAMAAVADPRVPNSSTLFSAGGRCGPRVECLVTDETHAVASGTSMAAPLVSGAIALLFERDPTLTQSGVRALLQAGARRLEGVVFVEQQAGPGALDIEGSLAAQIEEKSPVERLPSARSWLSLAASHARPDPSSKLRATLELRDGEGALADGFDPRRLRLEVRGAALVEPLARVAPGLHRFAVAAPAGSGGNALTLRVLFDETVLLSRSVPIGVDPGAATGAVAPRGGCTLGATSGPSAGFWLWAALALFVFGRARRGQSRTR